MITLRENQGEPIEKAIEFFQQRKPKPSLIVLPTAWGKSILTAYVAKNTADKLIVLQPSKELLEQNYLKYLNLCGDFALNAGIYSASFGRKEIAPITYATIGSIKNLGAKIQGIRLHEKCSSTRRTFTPVRLTACWDGSYRTAA